MLYDAILWVIMLQIMSDKNFLEHGGTINTPVQPSRHLQKIQASRQMTYGLICWKSLSVTTCICSYSQKPSNSSCLVASADIDAGCIHSTVHDDDSLMCKCLRVCTHGVGFLCGSLRWVKKLQYYNQSCNAFSSTSERLARYMSSMILVIIFIVQFENWSIWYQHEMLGPECVVHDNAGLRTRYSFSTATSSNNY
jgi:hypothetical protein